MSGHICVEEQPEGAEQISKAVTRKTVEERAKALCHIDGRRWHCCGRNAKSYDTAFTVSEAALLIFKCCIWLLRYAGREKRWQKRVGEAEDV
jgi:hypothetical protein